MPLKFTHNTFNHGELDPSLMARFDLPFYTKGAKRERNMISLWTGAARIAPGSTYTDVIIDRTGVGTLPIFDYHQVNALDFQYDTADDIIYTIIIRPDTTSTVAFDIYYDEILQASVGANMYTVAQIPELRFAVGQDRVLILHHDVAPRQLKRGANHATWTLSTFTISTLPVFDFTTLGGTQYRVAGFTFTPTATTGTTTLTASSAIFTANHIGGIFIGNGGTARITAVASSTSATIKTITDFISTAAIDGKDASLNEVMWTAGGGSPAGENRKWPARGNFYTNRLILGNSSALPNVAAFSSGGVYDDFDDSENDALAGFSVSFNGKGNQTIQSIVADDSLVFLTSNKLFAQSPLVETPLTVSNFYFPPQSQDAASDIEAVSIDNQILHVSGNYSQVLQVSYITAEAKYKASPAGLLSGQLFETINSNGAWEPKNIKARLYLATQENGTMLMYNTLAEQAVSAWSLRTTTGKFRRVIGDGQQAHVIVEREVNTNTSYFNEMDYVYLSNTDMTSFNDVSNQFTGVEIFENQYDYLVLGNDAPFTGLDWTFDPESSDDLDPTFEYLDGNGNWNTFTVTDSTLGFISDGTITWTFAAVPDWKPNTVNGIDNKFWIRIRRTTDDVTVLPTVDELKINTSPRLFLEKLDFDFYTDCTSSASSGSNGEITGLTALAGQQVYAISDGATIGPFFVSHTGVVNVEAEFVNVDVGMQYKPELVPMPLITPTQEGDNTYSEKYIQDLYIDYVDSLYLQAGAKPYLNDIPIIPLGDYTLGQSVPPVTGVYLLHPRGTWNARQEIFITQSMPGPMTIIGIGYAVEVG